MITDAYDAFAVQAATFAASEGVPVAYPGVEFSVPSSGLWLSIDWVPNRPAEYGISNDGPSMDRGLAIIAANGEPGIGLMPVLTLAEKARQAFGKGTRFGAMKVYTKPAITVLPPEPHRLSAIVTAQWHESM